MACALAACVAGCGKRPSSSPATVIRVEGSDTMVNLAQACAERYQAVKPAVSVQVLGGGSGVGITSLIEGNCDMANASRDISEKEIKTLREKRGLAPVEHIVGLDALAVFVHPDNPLESISLEELAEIYGDKGKTTSWTKLGVDYRLGGRDQIVVCGRQNSSGTYTFFREAVLGKKRDFRLGLIDRSGSKDLVELVSRTPLAIGYSGMGYATPKVKVLKISRKKGEPAIAPSVENAINRSYPLTRALQVYSAGELTGEAAAYMAWILGPGGQQLVEEMGYVRAPAANSQSLPEPTQP